MNKQKRKQSDNNFNNHIQILNVNCLCIFKIEKSLTSPKQTKKDTLVTSNSKPAKSQPFQI